MKHLLIGTSFVASLFASQVLAQANKFEGFDAHTDIGYQSSKDGANAAFDAGVSKPANTLASVSKSNAVINIGVGYTKALNNKFTLGAALDYNPIEITGPQVETPSGPPSGGTVKLKNQITAAVLPGYVFNQDSLAYFKLGYTSSKAKLTNDDGTPGPNIPTIQGMLYGVGVRKLINESIFGFAEYNYMKNNDVTVIGDGISPGSFSLKWQSSQYNILFGVGYKF
jgi:hypothetical protein